MLRVKIFVCMYVVCVCSSRLRVFVKYTNCASRIKIPPAFKITNNSKIFYSAYYTYPVVVHDKRGTVLIQTYTVRTCRC